MAHVIYSPTFGNADLLHEVNIKVAKLECPRLHFASRMAFLASSATANADGAGASASPGPSSSFSGSETVGRPEISAAPLSEGIVDIMLECTPLPAQFTGSVTPMGPGRVDGSRQPSTYSSGHKALQGSSPIVVYDRVNFWPEAASHDGHDLDTGAVHVAHPVVLDLQPVPRAPDTAKDIGGGATVSDPSPDLHVWYNPNVTITHIGIGPGAPSAGPAVWSLRQDMDPLGLRLLGVHFAHEPGSTGSAAPIRAMQWLVHAPPIRPLVRDPNEKVMVTTSASGPSDGKVMSPYEAGWIGGGIIAGVLAACASVVAFARYRRRREMGVEKGMWRVVNDQEANAGPIEAGRQAREDVPINRTA